MRTYIGAPGWPELALNVASTCQILSVIVAVVCGCGCGVDNAAEDGLNKQLRDGGDGGVKNPADGAIGTTNLLREVGWC